MLETGDVVRLATGGPWMTVKAVHADGTVDALWFNGTDFVTETWPAALLAKPV